MGKFESGVLLMGQYSLAIYEAFMTKKLLLISAIFISFRSYSQEYYGIINDPDGYTNIRRSPSTKAEITGKILTNEIFYIEGLSENWFKINLIEENYNGGYIHSSRVQRLSDLETIGKREYRSGSLTIKDAKYEFTIGCSDFDISEHDYELQDGKWIIKIDGTSPYGVDGDYPKSEISTFQFKIDGTLVNTPISAISDLYESNLDAISIFKNTDGTIFISMVQNSDGAGGYDAILLYRNGEFLKRVIIMP